MKPQRRLLADVCIQINEAAREWHRLVKQLSEGADVTPVLTDVEEQLERLFAEKRWLKAGGLDISIEATELERRVRMSLNKYRYSTAYDMPTIEMQLEGA